MSADANFHLVANALYALLNVAFFVPIAFVTHRLVQQYRTAKRKPGGKPNNLLFAVSIAFNGVTFLSAFGLLLMASVRIKSLSNGTDLHSDPLYLDFHSIFVLFYGKQNCLMLLVLYLRVYCIFKGTSMRFSRFTIYFFNACFTLAVTLFTLLPIMHSQYRDISIWTWCASSFCFFNITFMTTLTYFFLSKLKIAMNNVEGAKNSATRQSIANMMAKTSLLAVLSISITMTSCVLLVLRYSVHIDSHAVNVLSDWLIAVDIYTNFLFVSLTLAYLDKYYLRFFGCLDTAFKRLLRRADPAGSLAEYVVDPANTEKVQPLDVDAQKNAKDAQKEKEMSIVVTQPTTAPTAQRVQSISVTVQSASAETMEAETVQSASIQSTPSMDETAETA